MACLWGSGVAYGKMAGLWGSAKTYGKCGRRVAVWGNRETYGGVSCVGGRRIAWGAAKTYGKCHGIWEPAPAHGEAARPYGEPKITSKPEIWERDGLWTCTFSGIFVGTAVLWEAVEMHGIIKNMAMHEPPDVACGLRIFGNIGGGAWVWEMAPSTEATPESAVAAPLQAIGMLGVPVTALPNGGLHPACACRRVPPREAAETSPCTALPRRAAHVLGSSTGRRSSPGGRRSWGRGRGMPVCRSSGIRTWGTPFSCLQASTIRRDPLHITHAGRHGVCGSGYPACVRTCARAAACGDRQSNAAKAGKPASARPMYKGTRWIRRHCLIKAPCRIPALPGPLQRHALGPTCMGILRIQPY